ncbi:PilZ domain-containing protein [bacterium CPR1]|nr:PilZ domain-containing protein [bacterium CPR1]
MSTAVLAEAVHYEGGELVFLAPVGFVPGYLEPLGLPMPDGSTREIKLRVKTSRSLGDGRFLGVGSVLEGLAPDEQVVAQETPEGLRQAPRVPYRTGVVSPELPNYKALTLDCSLSGLQLQTDGPLPVGQVIQLSLDLRESGEPVPCLARVAWCRHAPDDGKYRVGLEFVEPAVDLELALKSVTDDVLGTAFDKTPAGVLKAQLSHQGPARFETLEEELSPLAGKIQKSWMDQERALHVEVMLDSGQLETVKIPATRLLRDYRDKQGHEVAALGCSQSSGGKRWRFLNYEQQAVLEVECTL